MVVLNVLITVISLSVTFGQTDKVPDSVIKDYLTESSYQNVKSIDDVYDELIYDLSSLVKDSKLQLLFKDLQQFQIYLRMYKANMGIVKEALGNHKKAKVKDFLNFLLSNNKHSVKSMITKINSQIIEIKLVDLLHQEIKENDKILCQVRQSWQQVLYNVLVYLLKLNLTTHLLFQEVFMQNKMDRMNYNIALINNNILNERITYQNTTERIITIFKPYIKENPRLVSSCDPEDYTENENYLEITNFVHGFILNEKSLNNKGRCTGSCSNYKYLSKYTCRDDWCTKQETVCPTILDCHSLPSPLNVCLSDLFENNRRYEYFLTDGKTYGKNQGSCFHNENLQKVLFKWTSCSYCLCLCEEGPKFFSDRVMNLRWTLSDIKNNKVVTGVRFVRKNTILYLQIQEGKLLPNGKIDNSTVRWVPTENYKISNSLMKEGRDYHSLTWSERELELADVALEQGQVVTGLRFKKIGKRLHLVLLGTKFNDTTGLVDATSNFQYQDLDVNFKQKFGQELTLENSDIPVLKNIPNNDISTHKFIKFTYTDFEKDAAQSTVPFIDAQPLVSRIPVPLSGVGIYHKGRKGSGGFIAPRMYTYDISKSSSFSKR